MEGEADNGAENATELTPEQQGDYSSLTFGFIAGVGLALVATIGLIVTKL